MAEKVETVEVQHGDDNVEDVAEAGPKKDKKKNKKKAKKDEPAPKVEEPAPKTNKKISKIKEEIARRREEEERLKREEEEAERKFQEELKAKEEQERIEKEKREKRKQKEKEKKMRLKAEGKLLTDKQKADRRKAMELFHMTQKGKESGDAEAPVAQRRTVYTKLKKRPQTIDEQKPQEDNGAASVSIEEKQTPSECEDVLDDWEKMADALEDSEPVETAKQPAELSKDDYERPEAFSHNENQLSEDAKRELILSAKEKLARKHEEYEANRSIDNLRSGIICVLGHVDTGKTKILDKLRHTNVQNREAGGITQQIGATNVPASNIKNAVKMCDYFDTNNLKIPGLLIIDTPGHESFSNLRVRGSSLCDVAILVVDIMHGLEEQTKESINLLLKGKTPFVVALNKVDRLYEWKSNPNQPVQKTLGEQGKMTVDQFNDHYKKVVQEFALMEVNVSLFYENQNPHEYINVVPTSAHSGDGMGDLMATLCSYLQTVEAKRLAFSEEFCATVMEVKEQPGLGMCLDVIIVNGRVGEGDTIVLVGQEGAISTTVRGVLQPAPMSELRVKNSAYTPLKEVHGAVGVRLIAKNLDKALAGMPLYVAKDLGEELYYREKVCKGLKQALKAISVSPIGVYVMTSTIGSLESLLVYLRSVEIPYSGISIGTVHKKDVMKASVMVERDPKWACILAFDVRVDREAERLANDLSVRIFTSDIIYRLQEQFENYIEEIKRGNRRKHKDNAIFPVRLSILPEAIFNKRAPIIMGVRVEAGILKEGTPICVPAKANTHDGQLVHLGRVFSIESNHKTVQTAKESEEVCIRIDPLDGDTPKLFGRHFDASDILVSKITRESIDLVKEHFRNDLSKDDWKLMVELKKLLHIM